MKPEDMDKERSDGLVGNTIIECKLNDNKKKGIQKAYKELYYIIPNRLNDKGEKYHITDFTLPSLEILEYCVCLMTTTNCQVGLGYSIAEHLPEKKLLQINKTLIASAVICCEFAEFECKIVFI